MEKKNKLSFREVFFAWLLIASQLLTPLTALASQGQCSSGLLGGATGGGICTVDSDGDVDCLTLEDMIGCTLDTVGMDKTAVQNAGQQFNASQNKSSMQAPTLRVVITPTDPKQGEEVVAKA
ncbi:hypothetical protein EPO05_01045, partial [Patescibacteria group bacterium]